MNWKRFKLRVPNSVLFSVLSVLMALLIGAVIILLNGENPARVYYSMIIQPLGSVNNILNVFYTMTPLMLTGLAFIVASRANMINLGLEGQMLLGALTAAWIGTLFPTLPRLLYIPLIMLGAMLAGCLWAMLPAFLQLKFGASQIVTCIMLNYVVEFFLNYIISGGHFKHPEIEQRTPYILDNAHMPSLSEISIANGSTTFRGVRLNAMFLIAAVFIILIYIMLEKTKWGYKINAVGLNLTGASANRINAKKVMFLSMALSGCIAGVAAMGEVLCTFNGVIEGFSPGYGFNGISVALLGRSHPLGLFVGALFFGIMDQGMMYVSTNTGVPKDFVKVLQTLIIIFVVLSPYFEDKWESLLEKRAHRKEAKAA